LGGLEFCLEAKLTKVPVATGLELPDTRFFEVQTSHGFSDTLQVVSTHFYSYFWWSTSCKILN